MWTLGFWIIQFSNHGTYCSTHLVIVIESKLYFLTNKYQQEYVAHGNKARALQRVITKVGTATLMTNLTTAAGLLLLSLPIANY
jgi:predicted RND superfamily exporter protein